MPAHVGAFHALPGLPLLLLRHRFAKRAHAFAEGFHRLRLTVNRFGEILTAQSVFCAIHCAPCTIKRITGCVPLGSARAGQLTLLTAQFVSQGALTIGQIFFQSTFAALAILALVAAIFTGLLVALALALTLLLSFARLTAFVFGTATLAATAAFIALVFTCLGAGVELLLQIAERLIAQTLLLAQRLRQAFHSA